MFWQAVSAACLLLGAKVEEVTKPVRDVVKAILYVRYKHSKPELEAAMVRGCCHHPPAVALAVLLHASASGCRADRAWFRGCCMQARGCIA